MGSRGRIWIVYMRSIEDDSDPDASDAADEFLSNARDYGDISDEIVGTGFGAVRKAQRTLHEMLTRLWEHDLLVYGRRVTRTLKGGRCSDPFRRHPHCCARFRRSARARWVRRRRAATLGGGQASPNVRGTRRGRFRAAGPSAACSGTLCIMAVVDTIVMQVVPAVDAMVTVPVLIVQFDMLARCSLQRSSGVSQRELSTPRRRVAARPAGHHSLRLSPFRPPSETRCRAPTAEAYSSASVLA